MPITSDSLNSFLSGPVRQVQGFEFAPGQLDTLYRWNLPPDTVSEASGVVQICSSPFVGHLLPSGEVSLPVVYNGLVDFGTGICCFVLFVMAFIFVYQRRKITLLLQSLYSKREAAQLLRESRLFNERIYLYTMLLVFTIQAFFLLLLAERFSPGLIGECAYGAFFILLVALVAADHYIKYFISLVFADLFEYQSLINVLKTNKFFYLTWISFVLFPLEIVALYTNSNVPFLIYAVVFIISYIFMIYNTISLNLGKVNWLLFFLYFCTVEILPYTVIFKFVLTHAAA